MKRISTIEKNEITPISAPKLTLEKILQFASSKKKVQIKKPLNTVFLN